MVTMTAALESGVINTGQYLHDGLQFTKTGEPYTNCWSSVSHGYINAIQALEVSCNYFFCEAAYLLGNARNGNTYEGIQKLNDYMVYYGLNDKTGVEIGELYDQYDAFGDDFYKISSPKFKEYIEQGRNPFASRLNLDWYDGDTVKTAIGQAFNNYTPAMMAKYVMTIANRGVRYPLHLLRTVESGGETLFEYEAVPEEQEMTVSNDTWDAIFEGMRLVVESGSGHTGTASQYFKDYPIKIAGKTGTAEYLATRPEHSSFAAFAPLNDPQIAVYISVPFGVSQAVTHIAVQIAKEVIRETLLTDFEPVYMPETNILTP
jgi:penicillin-binding protein 2